MRITTEITTAQHMSSLQPPEYVACVYESKGGNHRSRIWASMSNNFGHVVYTSLEKLIAAR